ncbi:hypothetical protein ASE75_13865 [Sphingomonas sp. Leaf17]|nr:hypothetical protein ASE75_13865 [Sphingomonas sp. Leaf17]
MMAVGAALATVPLAAAGQASPEPSSGTVSSAATLVQLLKLDGVLDTMFRQLTPMMTAQIMAALTQAPNAPAATKTIVANPAMRAKAAAIMSEEIMKSLRKRYPEIAAATARQYAATLSEADLQAAIAFYQTPTGQRMIAAQPRLQAALSEQGKIIGAAAGAEAVPAAILRIDALPTTAAPTTPAKQ